VPIELEEYSTHAVKDMLQTVFGVRQQWNPKLKFMGILANRFMHNSTRQKAALQDLFENYQDYVLPLKISTRAAIPARSRRAAAYGNFRQPRLGMQVPKCCKCSRR